ncbi:hypothetical protein [uncultured Ruminococcus sp.]|uniref:hypothetical protein n=1 Tax=uncultured Ruminococcus sp. TaxID=165186 RepID=UPI0025D2B5CB|nr:hypothetical protein [uncultured Ruminococcus sp.]
MTFSRCISCAIASAIVLSCCSCSDMNDYTSRSSRITDSETEYTTVQPVDESKDSSDADGTGYEMLEAVSADVEQLINDLAKPHNKDTVQSDIDKLLDMFDIIYEKRTFASVDFYSDYQNSEAKAAFQSTEHLFSIAEALISYGFFCGTESQYNDLFKDITPPEAAALYGGGDYDLETARAEAESAYLDDEENMNRYYDIVDDDTLSMDEKDLRCAEILIDMLADETPESFYDDYYRDYTGDEIFALRETVTSNIIPAYFDLRDKYLDTWPLTRYAHEELSETPFDVIQKYAGSLSPDIRESADRLVNEKLFKICSSEKAFDISFMDDLPAQNSAYIFIGQQSDEDIFSAAVHEFGHFHASFYDDTHAFLMKDNFDIAETQSQGMEILFTQFYDDIYGDNGRMNGDHMRLSTLSDICYCVFSAFCIGSFEYELVSRINDITSEEVVRLFNSACDDSPVGYHLSDIAHLYECPGYYISYATSALASLELFFDLAEDKDRAIEKYEKMAEISCYSGEYTFREALDICGFEDVITEKFITDISKKLSDYALNVKAHL